MAKREMKKNEESKDEELEGVETEMRPDGADRQQSFSNPLPSSHFSSPAGIPEVSDDVPSDAELLGWGDDEDCEDDDEEKADKEEDKKPAKKAPAKKSTKKQPRLWDED